MAGLPVTPAAGDVGGGANVPTPTPTRCLDRPQLVGRRGT